AYGTIDELNAALGVARSRGLEPAHDLLLGRLQNELFAVGSALADPDPAGPFHNAIGPPAVSRLEAEIDALESEIAPLSQFILPGGAPAAAELHQARTVCRRAEREVVRLDRQHGELVSPSLLAYINRLSDLLFVLARVVNHRAGMGDIPWSGL